MPTFYFQTDYGPPGDEEGVVLADLETAKIEAVALVGELLRDQARAFWSSPRWSMTVSNEDRQPLLSIVVVASLLSPAAF